jgi:hypothetical protein
VGLTPEVIANPEERLSRRLVQQRDLASHSSLKARQGHHGFDEQIFGAE